MALRESNQELHELLWSRQAIVILLDDEVVNRDNFDKLADDLVHHARFEYKLVFPILLTPCQWQNSSFRHIPVYPLNQTPISQWSSAEAGWNQVFHEIANVLNPYSSFYPESPRAIALRSVGKVFVQDKTAVTSGFLCNPYLLLTSTLLIDSKEKAKQASVTFIDAGGLSATFRLDPRHFFLIDQETGISMIGVKEIPYKSDYRKPRTIQDYYKLKIASGQVKSGEYLEAASFQSAQKILGDRQIVSFATADAISYSGPRVSGSAGGPLLNEAGEVVAVNPNNRLQGNPITKESSDSIREWKGILATVLPFANLYEQLKSKAISELNKVIKVRKTSNRVSTVTSFSKAWQPNGNNILVVGTGWSQLTDIESKVSDSIGRMLARKGFGLLGGGWQGVDYLVGKAYTAELHSKGISEKKHFTQIVYNKPSFVGGTTVFIGESYWYDEVISRAKAVIMVGGLGGTYITFEKAQANNIPVIPLVTTGGDARKAYLKMKSAFIERYGPNNKLSQQYKSLINNNLTTQELAKIVESMLDILLISPQSPQ